MVQRKRLQYQGLVRIPHFMRTITGRRKDARKRSGGGEADGLFTIVQARKLIASVYGRRQKNVTRNIF